MSEPKPTPPTNEERETVDPTPRGVDPERRQRHPKKPDDGPEADSGSPARSAPDSPEAEVASHAE
jgi:hypothetical protein